MINLRHDAIDAQEDYREEAKEIVQRVREQAKEIAQGADTFEDMLEEIALRVENELAKLTTVAAKVGAFYGYKRQKMNPTPLTELEALGDTDVETPKPEGGGSIRG